MTEGRGLYSRKPSNGDTVPMPTKKKRDHLVPAGMPSLLTEEESKEVIPAVYDGSRLKEKDPVKYAGIVQDLAAGIAVSLIRDKRKTSMGTIAMVRAREKDLIEQGKVVVKGVGETPLETFRDVGRVAGVGLFRFFGKRLLPTCLDRRVP